MANVRVQDLFITVYDVCRGGGTSFDPPCRECRFGRGMCQYAMRQMAEANKAKDLPQTDR